MLHHVEKPGPSPARYVGPGKLIAPGRTILQTKKALKDDGFKLLGMGMHQAALSKPCGRRVVKLAAGRTTGGWDAVQMFMAHPEIEAFPRIYGVAQMKDGAWAVEMERLKSDDDELFGEEISGHRDELDWVDIADSWGADVADAFDEHWGGYIDLHSQNWMLRGDTAVIIDPFNDYSGIREPKTERVLARLGTRGDLRYKGPDAFWSNVH